MSASLRDGAFKTALNSSHSTSVHKTQCRTASSDPRPAGYWSNGVITGCFGISSGVWEITFTVVCLLLSDRMFIRKVFFY